MKARLSIESSLSLESAREVFKLVDARLRAGTVLRRHFRTLLSYEGLPWLGELWLDSDTRLGPPSKRIDTLLGSQIVVVDTIVEGIGWQGVNSALATKIRELSVFISFVLGHHVSVVNPKSAWVWDQDTHGNVKDCTQKKVGYIELGLPPEFPKAGAAPPIDRRDAPRPGLGPYGITSDMDQEWVPRDIEELWDAFVRLPTDKREQLLQAGNAYLIGTSMWPEQRTAYAAFLVVACESLKPLGRRYKGMNVYDVVASLVSSRDAQHLREMSLHPQKIRSEHFHRGKLSAGELLPMFLNDHFQDPSFDHMLRVLSMMCRISLIEWLRVAGKYSVIRLPRDEPGYVRLLVKRISVVFRRLRLAK